MDSRRELRAATLSARKCLEARLERGEGLRDGGTALLLLLQMDVNAALSEEALLIAHGLGRAAQHGAHALEDGLGSGEAYK